MGVRGGGYVSQTAYDHTWLWPAVRHTSAYHKACAMAFSCNFFAPGLHIFCHALAKGSCEHPVHKKTCTAQGCTGATADGPGLRVAV